MTHVSHFDAKRPPVKIGEGVRFLLEEDKEAQLIPKNPNADWRKWNPGLDNGDKTLAQVYATLPGDKSDDMDLMVKLIENPKSPYAITGAISLQNHDCVHILLGRGLLPQDEAFVIGYTMGSAGTKISAEEVKLFKMIATKLYPDIYRFGKTDLAAYDIGFRYGQKALRPIYEFDFMKYLHRTLDELRGMFGVDVKKLRKVYLREKTRIPNSKESARLPL
ncbi:MAG TPA: hypothetical protein VHB73_08315 [Alphaproteobacteria bacterium]|nr:hypothetical protein [Alphaproteobacteria bacterium]